MTERPVNAARLKKMLHRMIDVYSPSGKEEEILEYAHSVLKRNGLPVKRQEVDDNRYNLLVMPEAEPELGLVGHLDTVAAYDLENYCFEEHGDVVKGLGSADMKGGCAAMLEAIISVHEKGLPLRAALAFVVGEEEEGDGADVLASEVHLPWAVIGEPTDMKPCLSNYSYIEVRLSMQGKRMHASLANYRQNPIGAMLDLIMRIGAHIEKQRPELIYNIRDLYSTRAGYIVPDVCEAGLDVHMPPASPIGEIVAEIEDVVENSRENNKQVEASIKFETIGSGYELPEKGPVVDALKEIFRERGLGWEPAPFRSHSDANLLWEAGVRPVLLGPGSLEMAHSPDECISLSQVVTAAEIYFQLASGI